MSTFTTGREGKVIIAACIPALNEEKTIAEVVSKARRYVDVVIVTDDGSSDDTARIAEEHGAIVVRHERTRGYGAALRSALKKALELGANVVVTLDADGQHDPSEIPKVVKPILEGKADVVIGSRFLSRRSIYEIPIGRRVGIYIINLIFRLWTGDFRISDTQSGFRAYSRRILPFIIPKTDGMGASIEILLRALKRGARIAEMPIFCKYHRTNMSLRNMIAQGIDALLPLLRDYRPSNSGVFSRIAARVLRFFEHFLNLNIINGKRRPQAVKGRRSGEISEESFSIEGIPSSQVHKKRTLLVKTKYKVP